MILFRIRCISVFAQWTFHSMIWKRICFFFFVCVCNFYPTKNVTWKWCNALFLPSALCHAKSLVFFFFSSLSDDDMHSSTQPLANYPIVYICFSLSGIFMVAHAVKHTIFYGFTHVCSQSMAAAMVGWEKFLEKNRRVAAFVVYNFQVTPCHSLD